MKNAALMRPLGSSAGTKFSSVVAMVPTKTAVLSHFYIGVKQRGSVRSMTDEMEAVLTKNVLSAAK